MVSAARDEDTSRYRNLIETMPDGYYRSTHEGRFVEVNQAFAAMLGYSVSELLDVDIRDALYFDEVERQAGDRNPSFGSPMEVYRLRRKDGSEVWVEDFARYERDDAGRVLYHEGICRDITQRRDAEEIQRKHSARSRILAELTSALLGARLDAEEILALSVQRCVELFGDGASIFLTDPGSPNLRLAAVYNVDHEAVKFFRNHFSAHPLTLTEGSFGRVIRTNEAILNEVFDLDRAKANAGETLRVFFEKLPVRTAMFAPLREEGRCIGVLGIGRNNLDRGSFTREDLAFFQEVADQAAIALSNAHLYQALERELAERRSAEERLRESEERYRALVDTSPDGIVVEADDRIVYLNEAALRIVGSDSPDRLIGKPIMDFLEHDSLADTDERQEELLSGNEPVQLGERILRRMDGATVVVEAEGAAVTYLGRPAFQIVFRDITERLESERQLRLQGTAVNTAANGIIITDTNGRVVWANPAFGRLTGYSMAETIGKDPRELVRSGQHSPEFYRAIGETMEQGRVWHGEIINRRKDGSFYTEEMTITPVRDDSGVITHFVQIKQDVSERKLAEEQMKSSLLEKEVLLKEIHHRVKNNLQVISSLMSLQADSVTDRTARTVFLESRHRIRAMAVVHEKLYRSDNLARVDFDEYLVAVAGELFRSFGSARIAQRFDVESVQLDVDTAIPCGLIVNELITNALKHGFPGGRSGTVAVTLKRIDNANVLLSVRDDGVGFPTDRDFRLMTSMGMTLAVSLTQQIGGDISLDASSGTRFAVRIPLNQ